MLSRVAESLYWIGRYLERAENVSRLLLVTAELSVEIEGVDEELAQAEWDGVVEAVRTHHRPGLEFAPESGLALPYVRWLLIDETNEVAVRHSLGKARENARSIREVLTREVFTNLNEEYRALDRLARRKLDDPVEAHRTVQSTHRGILTTLGAIEHTLSRDEGWNFMKLGEAIERTQRTLLVLRAKLPTLLTERAAEDLPLLYARWRGLLRAVASLENFRVARGADMDPDEVLRFLLFDRVAPRSVLCGVTRIRGYLDRLPGGEQVSEADRILGRLHAALVYEDDRILEKEDLPHFCSETADRLGVAHEAIARRYFPG